MLFVRNDNTDPYKNHGLEEWLMQTQNEDCFMLWRNDKAILLGRNQNVHSEINMPYADEHNIKIVRRITGGGTVFTDDGNIMFTFISCDTQSSRDFKKFALPIMKALQNMGVPVEFSGRNDLTINGLKFCGNAQCSFGNKVLHHGTIMYKANIAELANALRVSELKLREKGVASVKSRVTNVCEYINQTMDIESFRRTLFNDVMRHTADAKLFTLTDAQWQEVSEIAKTKYASKSWIYGKSPQFNVRHENKFAGGIIQVFLEIDENKIIKQAAIFGDFFGDKNIKDITDALTGENYNQTHISNILDKFDTSQYFGNIKKEELLWSIFENPAG